MLDKLALSKTRAVIALGVTIAFTVASYAAPDYLDEPFQFPLVWLPFLIAEVVVLWPLAWRWRARPEITGLTWAVLISSGVLFVIWYGIGIWFGTIEIAVIIFVPIIFLASSLLLALVAAKAADPEIRHSVGQRLRAWLRAELGEPPGAYWMAVLWLALAIALIQTLGQVFFFFRNILGIGGLGVY